MAAIFEGLSCSIAGNYDDVRKATILLKQHGGQLSFTISRKTDMLVLCGGKFTGKEQKARTALKLNVPIVSVRFLTESVAAGTRLGVESFSLLKTERVPEVKERCEELKRLKNKSWISELEEMEERIDSRPAEHIDDSPEQSSVAEHAEETAESVEVNVEGGVPSSDCVQDDGAAEEVPEVDDGWQTAKIFISSTFKDMHGERDYITRFVLPELQERCNALRVRVTAIDLRWGVTGEQQPLETCLGAVDDARPFFIGILGERYGWVPEVYEIQDHQKFRWLHSHPVGQSITHVEMYYGALRDPQLAKSRAASFYLRDPAFLSNVPAQYIDDFVDHELASKSNLASLKRQILASPFASLDNYPCEWRGLVDGKVTVGSLEAFGNAVLENLWQGMQHEFGGRSRGSVDPHETFVYTHSEGFVGRQNLLQQMHAYVGRLTSGQSTVAPLVVAGVPGSGKTSLVAHFTKTMLESKAESHISTLCHFVGGAPGSTDLRNLLTRVIGLLAPFYGSDLVPAHLPNDIAELQALFRKLLSKQPRSRVVLVIDALNQMDEMHRSHELEWLPSSLPEDGVRVIVSALPSKVLDVLHRRDHQPLSVGPLLESDRKEIVRSLLQQHGKRLSETRENNQLAMLLSKRDSVKPLYLVIACEELRVFGIYEQLSSRIQQLSETVPELLSEVLTRLEGDHGERLVKLVLMMIAVSRGGLTSDEIYAVLRRHVFVSELDEEVERLWKSLKRSLEVFVTYTGTEGDVMCFFHEQLEIAVKRAYAGRQALTSSSGYVEVEGLEREAHEFLADMFHRQLLPFHDENNLKASPPRAIAHVLYHAVLSESWEAAARWLQNIAFIETKCTQGGTYDLVWDYLRITQPEVRARFIRGYSYDETASEASFRAIDTFRSFVQYNSHHLQRRPELAFSLALSMPAWSAPSIEAEGRWNALFEKRPHVRWRNKPAQERSCLLTMWGHDALVHTCHAHPDASNPLVASGGEDSAVRVWHTRTGEEVATLKGHEATVFAVAFSPCGRFLASGSWDRQVRLWSAESFLSMGVLLRAPGPVLSLTWSEDGRNVVVGTLSGDVMVAWVTAAHGQASAMVSCMLRNTHQGKVHDVHCRAGGWIASAGADGKCKIWDGERQLQHTLECRKSVRACAFGPGEHARLLACAVEKKVQVWDYASETCVQTLCGHKDDVASLTWSPSGDRIISASHDNIIVVWCTKTWNQLGFLQGHTGTVLHCCMSPSGNAIITSSYDRSVKVWDASRLLTSTETHTARILGIAFSRNGRVLATGSRDKTSKLWRTDTAENYQTLVGHRSNVTAVDCSPSGELVVSASRDGTAGVWNSRTGALVHTLQGHTEMVTSCCFSPSGAEIVTASEDKTARVWSAASGECVATLFGHRDAVNCVAYSHDGLRIATGSKDCTVKLWNAVTRCKVATLARHTAPVLCVSFSRDGSKVLSGGDDWKVVECSALNAKLIHEWRDHAAAVRGCSYSANGKMLVSVSTDSLALIYDCETKKEVCAYAAQSRITCVAFNHIGSEFALGDGSGQMYILTPVLSASSGRSGGE